MCGLKVKELSPAIQRSDTPDEMCIQQGDLHNNQGGIFLQPRGIGAYRETLFDFIKINRTFIELLI